MPRILLAAVVVAVALFAAPALAGAAVVRVDPTDSRLLLAAAPGEANDVEARRDPATGGWTVRDDDGAPLAPGEGCAAVDPSTVACAPADLLDADLGDGADALAVTGAVSVTVRGGPGDDRIDAGAAFAELDCGEGEDAVAGTSDATTGPTCERARTGPLTVTTLPVARTPTRLTYAAHCPGPDPCRARLEALLDGARIGRSRPVTVAPGAKVAVAVLLDERGWRALASRWEADVALRELLVAPQASGFTRRIEGGVPGLRDFLAFVEELGPQVEGMARAYDPRLSGAELLAKTLQGESRFKMTAVSRVGARGAAQFMPASRRIVLRRFGVDPWRSRREAVVAMVHHLQGRVNGRRGLYGYNPGGHPWYTRYILGQPIPPIG